MTRPRRSGAPVDMGSAGTARGLLGYDELPALRAAPEMWSPTIGPKPRVVDAGREHDLAPRALRRARVIMRNSARGKSI